MAGNEAWCTTATIVRTLDENWLIEVTRKPLQDHLSLSPKLFFFGLTDIFFLFI